MTTCLSRSSRCLMLVWIASPSAAQSERPSWCDSVPIPPTEKIVRLFNGIDLTGWEGQIDEYWSVDGGEIRASNTRSVAASTYLFTQRTLRDFRLLLEVKQTRGERFSTMHSAVGVLGEKFEDQGNPFGFRGPLLMFCNDWGIWDAHRRNRLVPPHQEGVWLHSSERVGEWNRVEILVVANRVRMVNNGQLVFDFTDEPRMLRPSPIGLQLHSNSQPQEFRFRGLILSENPVDRLVTVEGLGEP